MAASADDTNGTDDVQDRLRKLSETEHLNLAELFSPAFMEQHTAYAALEDMLEASGLLARTPAEAAATLHSEGWDAFVSQTTEFESWTEMQRAAEREARRSPGA
jgi:hypothetical protein